MGGGYKTEMGGFFSFSGSLYKLWLKFRVREVTCRSPPGESTTGAWLGTVKFGQKRNFPVFLGRSRLQHLLPFTTGNLYNTERLSGGRTTRPPTNYNQPAHCALPSLRPFMHAETRRSSNRYRINDDILIQMRINFVNQWPSGTALHFPHPFASRNDFLIRCLWQPVCYPNGGPGACAVEEAVT